MKNLIKFSILSLFIFLTVSSSQTILAATTAAPIQKTQAVPVAEVNIQDAKIVSQQGDTFNISFKISNGKGIQSDLKYGVKLVSKTKNGQVLADEKIYDGAITLAENSVVPETITYTAPAMLNGTYSLVLFSSNENGFPFALDYVQDVKLVSSLKGLAIMPETCYLQIVGDKTASHYSLLQGVYINKDQTLSLTCSAVNNGASAVTATPSYETRLRSSYGVVANATGGDTTALNFKSLEKKTFTLALPKAAAPEAYNIKVGLMANNTLSNTVSVQYALNGENAIISNLSFDKDYYNAGDTANLSLVWASSMKGAKTIVIHNTLSDDNGNACAKESTQSMLTSLNGGMSKIKILVTGSCFNPTTTITLKDDKGTVLDQKTFSIQTKSVARPENTTTAAKNNHVLLFIILLLITMAIIFAINKRNRRNRLNTTLPIVFLLLMAVVPFHAAKAYTYIGGPNGDIGTIVNINKGPNGHYKKSEIISITGSVTNLDNGGSTQVTGTEYMNDNLGRDAVGINYTALSGQQVTNQTITQGNGFCAQDGTGSGADFGYLRILGSCSGPSGGPSQAGLTAATNTDPGTVATLVAFQNINGGDTIYSNNQTLRAAPNVGSNYTVDFNTGIEIADGATPPTITDVSCSSYEQQSDILVGCGVGLDKPTSTGADFQVRYSDGYNWAGPIGVHIDSGQTSGYNSYITGVGSDPSTIYNQCIQTGSLNIPSNFKC